MAYKDLEKQYEWNKNYVKENYKRYELRAKRTGEADIIAHLDGIKESGGSINEYIMGLIKKDIAKQRAKRG